MHLRTACGIPWTSMCWQHRGQHTAVWLSASTIGLISPIGDWTFVPRPSSSLVVCSCVCLRMPEEKAWTNFPIFEYLQRLVYHLLLISHSFLCFSFLTVLFVVNFYSSVANNRQQKILCFRICRLAICPVSVSCPLTAVLRVVISMHSVKRFQWNLSQIIIVWAGIVEKVLKIRGRRSRS